LGTARASSVVVDAIHGDIHLRSSEWRVVDTASFQRLRHIKQLGLGQLVYPNATHTRFAHSLGVLGVMDKVCTVAQAPLNLSPQDVADVRLAGLLHDIGHYPHSHLMEKVDEVRLTEEFVEGVKRPLDVTRPSYPDHVELGELILTSQPDLTNAAGGTERAQRIADLFRSIVPGREHLSKLVHSSLDIDRLDYLPRDAHATGVPYGQVDLNYLLNNLKASPTGMLGVEDKAIPAAEQSLFARFFMYRTVYYHKTTHGLEEACRQMLRRLRDRGVKALARDGDEIRQIVTSKRLGEFTDAYVDRLVLEAATSDDPLIGSLANAIRNRRPPKLLKEVCVFEEAGKQHHAGTTFTQSCQHRLRALANGFGIRLGQFLFCATKPLTLEERGSRLSETQARELQPEEREELIKVFLPGQDEPVSLVSIPHSLVATCSNHFFQAFRLYLVWDDSTSDKTVDETVGKLRQEVGSWDRP